MPPRKIPPAGPIPARYMIVGEAPGADEERIGKPFVGKSGWLLDDMLDKAGIGRAGCFITNVCKYRPPANKLEDTNHAWWTEKKSKAAKFDCGHFRHGMHYNDLVAEGLDELQREVLAVRPECIIALGNAALWALTGQLGIAKWRGSELWWNGPGLTNESIPVIPIYHPAYVLRVWEWKATVVHDLRTRVVGKMGNPAAREMPHYRFTVAEGLHRVNTALTILHDLGMINTGMLDLTCDVETRHGHIACVGIGWSELDALCIPFMHVTGERYWPEHVELELAHDLRALLEHPRVRLINQNFNYDRQYFIRDPAFGFRPRLHYDTMIGQHLLYPGAPKDLAHQSSLYCKWHRYWKDEGKEIETEDEPQWWHYNCRDCVATWEIAQVTRPMLVKAGFAVEGL